MNVGGRPADVLAALAEPTRRALYEYVAGQPEPVGRDAAAAALGITRSLAAFHLDRLADVGLLAVEYRRLTGRAGPGAGRPSKLYRATSREVSFTLPERNYLLAARILLEALAAAPELGPRLTAVARRYGRQLGRRMRTAALQGQPAKRSGLERAQALEAALAQLGYGPVHIDGVLQLANCPFRVLAEQNRDLTCAANFAMLQAVARELDDDPPPARLVHAAGWCCVRFLPTH